MTSGHTGVKEWSVAKHRTPVGSANRHFDVA
jgi:hypothetical protein